MEAWLKLGIVGRPHGLRGAFSVAGRDTPIPKSYQQIRIGGRDATIIASSMQGGRSVLLCSLADDRNAAELLIGQEITVRRTQAAGEKPAVFWGDLPGLKVLGSDALDLGTVSQVYSNGVTDIIEVTNAEGRERVDIPLIDAYIDLAEIKPGLPVILKVAADTFADLWSAVPPQKNGNK